ncbi:hypothetical protein VST7929_02937 [Vibrio stylophorae]|uniref:Integral membrane protein n=1 Tax=Vibrio stylophorae TaxID=659351 RepID=A0ABN8DYF9_9VIBR|nr:hypothetical protein [Vibrio stylophorae]CAH0535344.1 hypothetical protein VST7929_02937 [Vibrio stylophorae]
MSPETTFRFILISNIVAIILSAIAGIGLEGSLPMELQTYLAWEAEQDVSTFLGMLMLTILALYIINVVGLWKFKPWAKKMYVVFTACSFIPLPLLGPTVMNAWEYMLYDIAILLEGALLVLLFVGPVANKFNPTFVECS